MKKQLQQITYNITADSSAPVFITLAFMLASMIGFAQTAYMTQNDSMILINVVTSQIVGGIKVGTYPWGVSVSNDGNKVYISNQGSNAVSVINTSANTVSSTIPVGSSPVGIVVNADVSRVYVANFGDSTLTVIDATVDTVLTNIKLGHAPYAVAVTPDGSKLYVTSNNYPNRDSTVTVVNTTTNTVSATIKFNADPYDVAVTTDGSKLYVTHPDAGKVSVVNTSTDSISDTIPFSRPRKLCIYPDGTKIYVTPQSGGSVGVINTATNVISDGILLASHSSLYKDPFGISVSPDGSKLCVSTWFLGVSFVVIIDAVKDIAINALPLPSGSWSFGNFITPHNVLGIHSYTIDAANISIYPNPFNSQATIAFSEEQKNTIIKITDLLGKEIRKINFTGEQLKIDKGELSSGIYFVQIIDDKKNVVNKKIIVQ